MKLKDAPERVLKVVRHTKPILEQFMRWCEAGNKDERRVFRVRKTKKMFLIERTNLVIPKEMINKKGKKK